jgi:hypothetical protein
MELHLLLQLKKNVWCDARHLCVLVVVADEILRLERTFRFATKVMADAQSVAGTINKTQPLPANNFFEI